MLAFAFAFCEHFLSFGHFKVLQAHLVLFPALFLELAISPRSLVPSFGEWYWKSRPG